MIACFNGAIIGDIYNKKVTNKKGFVIIMLSNFSKLSASKNKID